MEKFFQDLVEMIREDHPEVDMESLLRSIQRATSRNIMELQWEVAVPRNNPRQADLLKEQAIRDISREVLSSLFECHLLQPDQCPEHRRLSYRICVVMPST